MTDEQHGIYRDRIAQAQAHMSQEGISLMALFPSSNMFYLSGFVDEPGERLLVLLVPQDDEPLFVAPTMYRDQIVQRSPFHDIRAWDDHDDPLQLLGRTVAELGLGKNPQILMDDEMWATFVLMIEAALPGASFSLASQVMVPLRIHKSADEVRWMEEAGVIADGAFEEVIQTKFIGKTELEIASELEKAMKAHGGEKTAFEILVASGPYSALPHYRAGQRRIELGDIVILDYGCRINGYCSDITRTVVCGEPTVEILKVYEVVQSAQEAGVNTVKPGVQAQEVDRATRKVIANAGYGERFLHRTGHGVGLNVHEAPYIVEGNSLSLGAGMAFSVEPGIYLADQFGVRVEDLVVVTEAGVKWLNNCTRDLQIVA